MGFERKRTVKKVSSSNVSHSELPEDQLEKLRKFTRKENEFKSNSTHSNKELFIRKKRHQLMAPLGEKVSQNSISEISQQPGREELFSKKHSEVPRVPTLNLEKMNGAGLKSQTPLGFVEKIEKKGAAGRQSLNITTAVSGSKGFKGTNNSPTLQVITESSHVPAPFQPSKSNFSFNTSSF